jgi:hypothetical protein
MKINLVREEQACDKSNKSETRNMVWWELDCGNCRMSELERFISSVRLNEFYGHDET